MVITLLLSFACLTMTGYNMQVNVSFSHANHKNCNFFTNNATFETTHFFFITHYKFIILVIIYTDAVFTDTLCVCVTNKSQLKNDHW